MSEPGRNDEANLKEKTEPSPAWLRLVRDYVRSLKFGTVQITVHDSRVVQVERAERLRFDKPEQNDG